MSNDSASKNADDRRLAAAIISRFISYAKIHSSSDSKAAALGERFPSTECQRDMAEFLYNELNELIKTLPEPLKSGSRVSLDERCYALAYFPASAGFENQPSALFSAHIDVSDETEGRGVKPILHERYAGGVIALPSGIELSPEVYPELNECIGGDIITSSGDTLLGADDKAGVAEIMTALDYVLRCSEIPHGPIEVLFSPDEETGRGMDYAPLDKIKAKAAYTVDGGSAPEIESECFNAFCVQADFTGVPIHPGSARGVLVNAACMAASFIAMLPRSESPEATDGYYGFYLPTEISGTIESARVNVILRDFDRASAERRIQALHSFAEAVKAQYPGGNISLTVKNQYSNMKEKIDESPRVMELLVKAVRRAGLEPVIKPIRGGTDGARLAEAGIPTPNIFTGGHNFHSRYEWASVSQMTAACKTIIELISLYALEARSEEQKD